MAFPRRWTVSATEGQGIAEAWADMTTLTGWRRDKGLFATRRAEQARHWFEEEVRQTLLARLITDPATRSRMDRLGRAVEEGLSPSEAARQMCETLNAP